MSAHWVFLVIALLANQAVGQQSCSPSNCIAPSCRCASTTPPGNLTTIDVPQFVFLSFDGAITTSNVDNYTALFTNRYNPNGCPVSFTFFTFHEYNDYTLTHRLYFKGQEIATLSLTHSEPASDWKTKNLLQWEDEIGGMRKALAKFANIPESSITGARAPYLQTSGNATMQAVKNLKMYDSSYTTQHKGGVPSTPIWPYTLDFGLQHECTQEPCPTGSFPGVWTVPMISLLDSGNVSCAMVDACKKPNTTAEAFNLLKSNFLRHYSGNKAPFGLYMNANVWFQTASYLFDAYRQFLDYLGGLNDVYIVSMSQGLNWIKNPVKHDQISNNCPTLSPTSCSTRSCYYDGDATPNGDGRFMKSCVTCPNVYPWVGNPLGQ